MSLVRVAFLVALLAAPAAHAQQSGSDLGEEADLEFELGIDAYRAGHFRDALEHLLISNRLVPNKNVIYNIAKCYEQLGRYPDAYRHYVDYLAMEQDPAGRSSAQDAIGRIRPKVALVRVMSDPPGATLYIDRVDLGARGVTPRTLALEPGSHRILLEMDGHTGASSAPIDLVVGEETTVALDLPAILGKLQVDGDPEGAAIRLDREDGPVVGTLPSTVAVPPGHHVLVVTAPGYATGLHVVDIAADKPASAVVHLDRNTGSVVVDAAERGAVIEIDGVKSGFTPTVLAVPEGKHHIRVSLPGYRAFEEDIDVVEHQPITVSPRLRPEQEVTAASRTAQAVEDAPASVSLITQQEIAAFGYQSIYEALQGTRGVIATDDHSYEYVEFRGFSRLGSYNNRVLMTLDGHTLNDDNLGASYLGHDLLPDLDDIERIEVVRGPGSALYGTNAFSGVINLVSRDGDTMRPPHLAVAAFDNGAIRTRGGWSKKLGDDGGVWMSLAGIAAQGQDFYFPEYDYGKGGDDGPDCDGDGSADAIRCDGVSKGADGFVSLGHVGRFWKGDFTLETYYNTRVKHVPHGSYGSIYGDKRTRTDDARASIEARYEPALGDKTRLYTRLYLDHYEYNGSFTYGDDLTTAAIDPTVSAVLWDGTWTGAEPRIVSTPVPWLRFTAGAEAIAHLQGHLRTCLRYDDGTAPRFPWLDTCDLPASKAIPIFDARSKYQVASGYAVADLMPASWMTASLGGRVDAFIGHGTSFNPRGSLILKPGDANTVKLLGGTAFRAPSPYEQHFFDDITQLPVDPDHPLQPEKIGTGEVELTHRFSDVTTATAAAWYSRIDELIDTVDVDADAGTFRYANLRPRVHAAGADLEVRRDWHQGSMLALVWSAQRTRSAGPAAGAIKALTEGIALSNSPQQMWSLKGAFPIGPTTLANRFDVEAPRLTSGGRYTAPELLWDATLTGSVPAVGFDWAIGVRNLLDWKYGQPGGPDLLPDQVPQIGRNLYASARMNF